MSGLGEQIAVLDGLGSIPSVLPPKYNVIDPSGGANYGGGSSYPGNGWPLLPSSAGLAALDDLSEAATRVYSSASGGANYSGGSTYPDVPFPLLSSTIGLADLPNVAPRKRVFASYSGGANYSGGSNYPDGGQFPTWAQAGAGLADLQAAAARVYASASGGANYSGGSTYPDVPFPLTASHSGLAGCSTCGLSGLGATPLSKKDAHKSFQAHMAKAKQAILLARKTTGAKRAALLSEGKQHLFAACQMRKAAGLPGSSYCNTVLRAAAIKFAKMNPQAARELSKQNAARIAAARTAARNAARMAARGMR